MAPAINQGREDVDSDDSASTGLPRQAKEEAGSVVSGSSSSSSGGGLATPPDGGWGWVVVVAAFMVNLIADGVSFSFGFLFMELVHFFGASKAKTSWACSVFLGMPLLAGPVASYLIDRYGCRRMCILGALLAAASFVLSIFVDSLEVLFVTFSLAGFGLALCYVTSIVIVAYYFEKRRSLATGLAACGTGIGTFVFPPLTTYLLEVYAWRGTLLLMAGFLLNMVVFGALMRDLEPPPSTGGRPSPSGRAIEGGRLCSSMVQLPTYLRDDSGQDLATTCKEGYMNALLDPFVPFEGKEEEEKGSSSCRKKLRNKSTSRTLTGGSEGQKSSLLGRLDAAQLRNMKVQRGSITYRGAMLNIHRYRLKASSCPNIFRNSMVTIAEEKPCLFLHDLKVMILEMFDFGNFKNVGYTMFCLSNFLLYICVDVPYVYIPDHVTTTGTDMQSASVLISVLGVFNCLGVVVVGYIGDKPWIDSSLLYSGFILVSGVSLVLLPVLTNYYMTATLVGIYGFMISANYTLVPIIIVQLISLDDFTGAYGLLLLVQGIASLVGPPAAGALFDHTGNYDITFYCTGIVIIISGILVIPVAKSLLCGKSSTSKSTDSVRSEPDKVTFPEPIHPDSVRFLEAKREMNADMACTQNEKAENCIPLIPDKEKAFSSNDLEKTSPTSVYENPMSLV